MAAEAHIDRPLARTVGSTIFISRWLQAPLYLGLIAAQGVYVWRFMQELWHLVTDAGHLTENEVMLLVLGLVDVVMIANLLIMVIIGGYETFVSRINLKNHPDQPEWLSHVNANVLKVKLAMAIVGISSIHLLQTFINAANTSSDTMLWQTIIHLTFVISAVALATDRPLPLPQERAAEHMPSPTARRAHRPRRHTRSRPSGLSSRIRAVDGGDLDASTGGRSSYQLAEDLEGAPEALLGALLVERVVDVGDVEGVDGGGEGLDLALARLDRAGEGDLEAVEDAQGRLAHDDDDLRLHDRHLLDQAARRTRRRRGRARRSGT